MKIDCAYRLHRVEGSPTMKLSGYIMANKKPLLPITREVAVRLDRNTRLQRDPFRLYRLDLGLLCCPRHKHECCHWQYYCHDPQKHPYLLHCYNPSSSIIIAESFVPNVSAIT